MCDRFKQNRERFADLVYSTKVFTAKGIIKKFKVRQHGDIVIDGCQTIGGYLRMLCEDEVLECNNGRYRLAK
jgi:hypothetical protein